MVTRTQGNKLHFSVPLQQYSFSGDTKVVQDFVPQTSDTIRVWLIGNRKYRYLPDIDGNVLLFDDNGELLQGKYDLKIDVRKADGTRHRAYHENVLEITKSSDEVTQDTSVDFDVESTELAAAVFEMHKGDKGDSAYEVAVKNGFDGTEEEWLESLQGRPGPPGEGFHIFTPYRLSLIRQWKEKDSAGKVQMLWLQGDWQRMIDDGYVPYLFRNMRQAEYRIRNEHIGQDRWRAGWQRLGDHTTLRITEEGAVEFVRTMERWRDNDTDNLIDEEHFENENTLGPVVAWRNTGDYGYTAKIEDWLPRIVKIEVPAGQIYINTHYADFGDYDFPEPEAETSERISAYVPTGTGRRRKYFTQILCREGGGRNWYQGKYLTATLTFGIGFARQSDNVTTGDLVTPLVTFKVRNIWNRKTSPRTAKWIYLI